jgi:peroxiredoxin
MKTTFTLLAFLIIGFIYGQNQAPNFTVTDTGDKTHKLYEDYLDKGKIVVLKIFFVDCPPCNSIAPAVQQKYLEWGSGNGNVQFIEITNKIGDNNNKVKNYKNKHGISFPSVSSEGNALSTVEPYINGTLGQWSGTPFFAVITPDRKIVYDVLFNNLNAIVANAGGTMLAPPNTVSLNISSVFTTLPAGVSYHLKSATDPAINYNITQLTSGTNQFSYPSAVFPEVTDPIVVMESTANAGNSVLSVSDLVAIRNHILATIPFVINNQKIASDVNNDGKISVADLVVLQKVIAGILTNFPNNVPSYKLIPSQIPLTVPAQGGGTISINAELIKMGNVK